MFASCLTHLATEYTEITEEICANCSEYSVTSVANHSASQRLCVKLTTYSALGISSFCIPLCLCCFVVHSQEQLCPFPRRAWERGVGCLRLRVFVSLWFNPKSNFMRSHAEHGNEVLGVCVFVSSFLCGSIPRATSCVPTQSMGTRCWVFASSCLCFIVVQSQEQLCPFPRRAWE